MMKFSLFVSFLVLIANCSFSQSTNAFALKEYCKSAEIELMTGDSIPDSFVVVGMNQIQRTEGLNALEKLNAKQIKFIKKWAIKFVSCNVFVDFNGVVGGNPNDDKLGSYADTHINFYCLRKLVQVVTI